MARYHLVLPSSKGEMVLGWSGSKYFKRINRFLNEIEPALLAELDFPSWVRQALTKNWLVSHPAVEATLLSVQGPYMVPTLDWLSVLCR